jgi:seryl-tRNA synthetase
MARLAKYELDAVVDTTIEQIESKSYDAPEQVEYRRLLKLKADLKKQAGDEYKAFRKSLVEKYSKLSEGLEVDENHYDGIQVSSPNRPKSSVKRSDIERDLIIANISGNVEETIDKIVTKYTTN